MSDTPNVIFLDLEGVIVTHRTVMAYSNKGKKRMYHGRASDWLNWADKTALGLIALLCVNFNAQVCLTSTLRSDRGVCERVRAFLDDFARDHDHDAEMYCGETPNLENEREKEIRAFIEVYEVKRFVVIDDRPLEIENFIRTDPHEGFTYRNWLACRPYLYEEAVQGPNALNQPAIFL